MEIYLKNTKPALACRKSAETPTRHSGQTLNRCNEVPRITRPPLLEQGRVTGTAKPGGYFSL
jgi:hypothetical protein